MTQGTISGKEWLTLKEASEMTGRSLNALRLLVHRKKIDNVRKIVDNGRSYWLIHRDTLDLPLKKESTLDKLLYDEAASPACPGEIPEICPEEDIFVDGSIDGSISSEAQIPLEHYEQQRSQWLEERDSLMHGLMMYRFKFEDMERQIKLLPAPPDIMSRELRWKDETLKDAQRIIEEKDEAITESKKMIRDIQKSFEDERALRDRMEMELKAQLERERSRSWWKKLLGIL